MIVPSMTSKEIYYELFNDLPTLNGLMPIWKTDFRRKVLKARNFPYTHSYEHRTRLNKNRFILSFSAFKRGHAEKPFLSVYGIYRRPEGNYVAEMNPESGSMTIYPPHFFKRYRERVINDTVSTTNQILYQFIDNSWGFIATAVNKDQEAICRKFESIFHDELVSFVGVTHDGYCFGETQGNINIMKTIISGDMLFNDQKELFTNLRMAFDDCNKLRYGKELNK